MPTLTTTGEAKRAVLYRMVMPEHICPYGLKSLDLLRRHGYDVEDRHLTTKEETDNFKKQQGVQTTPQTFIEGRRVGGHDDLRAFFGSPSTSKNAFAYWPVIAIFGMAAAMAVSLNIDSTGSMQVVKLAEQFVAIAVCLLALQKLRDVESFSTMFLNGGFKTEAQHVVIEREQGPAGPWPASARTPPAAC
ncbi:glutaredoxin [Pseudorhodoferax sp. LjRoot39]|uniref:glutaredoxin domain-containing protein n=1 Tax=Pseudorhodoferax sp. LjRoot39 TaxID=3342328 RepID=UPI003ECEEFFE